MTAIGEATRVHVREERARIYYLLARGMYQAARREGRDKDILRRFFAVLYARSAWSTLREIIDAEERRAKVAA